MSAEEGTPDDFPVERLIGGLRHGEVTNHGEYAGVGDSVDLEHGWPKPARRPRKANPDQPTLL